MKALLLALLLLPLSFAYGQSKKALNEKYGFRAMSFESPVENYPDLVVEPTENLNDNTAWYSRPSDELKIGAATLSKISYQFYKGKLAAVLIRTEGTNNSLALLSALREQYGRGYPALQLTDEVLWDASKVTMYYRRNQFSGDGRVLMSSVPMTKLRDSDTKQASKNAKDDL